MGKTRRDLGANRRHEHEGHKIDHYLKKMQRASMSKRNRFGDGEDDSDVDIDHTNYRDFIDEDEV